MKKAPPLLAAMQEKPNPNAWRKEGETYIFRPNPDVSATLAPEAGRWAMTVVLGRKTFVGMRPTLEEAFKATDRLLYLRAKDVWLKSLCSAATVLWAGSLEE